MIVKPAGGALESESGRGKEGAGYNIGHFTAHSGQKLLSVRVFKDDSRFHDVF